MLTVTDRYSGKKLTHKQILFEVNRDRSEEWQAYTRYDIRVWPNDILMWIDPEFYIIGGE